MRAVRLGLELLGTVPLTLDEMLGRQPREADGNRLRPPAVDAERCREGITARRAHVEPAIEQPHRPDALDGEGAHHAVCRHEREQVQAALRESEPVGIDVVVAFPLAAEGVVAHPDRALLEHRAVERGDGVRLAGTGLLRRRRLGHEQAGDAVHVLPHPGGQRCFDLGER